MNAHLQTLIEYQAWRRDEGTASMAPAAVIGESLDYAIAVCKAAEALVFADDGGVDAAYAALEAAVMDKPLCKPGDLPPVGYLAWHEWAEVQHKAGIRQVQCSCGLWLFPQEVCKHGK